MPTATRPEAYDPFRYPFILSVLIHKLSSVKTFSQDSDAANKQFVCSMWVPGVAGATLLQS